MARKRIDPLRAAVATALMLAPCAVILLAVRNVPEGVPGSIAAVAGGMIFMLIPASILEWLVHRYVYHRRRFRPLAQIYRIHHQGHHAALFPTWRYTTNGAVRRHPVLEPDVSRLYPAGWRNTLSKAAHTVFYLAIASVFIWTPAWLLTRDKLFLASIVLTSIVVADLLVRVHDAIHYPGQFKLVEAQPWYPFIDRHHFIHHVDMEANVNFLLPLADWCYGTLRTALTPAEIARHGTFERAKATRAGHSEPAAVFAAELKGRRRRTTVA